MDHAITNLLDTYANDADNLSKSIVGLTREDLLAFPVPGTWSIQQIVLHLADSDLILADRMKRVIAEDNPPLIGFSETKYAARLHYEDQDATIAADIFAKNRRLMSSLLRRLPESDFQRTGMHNERGRLTLTDLVKNAAEHLPHHLKFIHDKRRLLGKPL
jgi:uncharacterized damage-inducible protein DinB